MRSVGVGEFKAHCLRLLEEVRTKNEGLLVTKRGTPMAEILPFRKKQKKAREELLDSVTFEKDIVSPIGEKWTSAR